MGFQQFIIRCIYRTKQTMFRVNRLSKIMMQEDKKQSIGNKSVKAETVNVNIYAKVQFGPFKLKMKPVQVVLLGICALHNGPSWRVLSFYTCMLIDCQGRFISRQSNHHIYIESELQKYLFYYFAHRVELKWYEIKQSQTYRTRTNLLDRRGKILDAFGHLVTLVVS